MNPCMNIEQLACDAYRAYGRTTDFKNYQGLPMPEWDALPIQIREAWRQAVISVANAEREACCAILASAEPNTRAERVVLRLDARMGELPTWVAPLLAEWCEATADELRELQALIRERADGTEQLLG